MMLWFITVGKNPSPTLDRYDSWQEHSSPYKTIRPKFQHGVKAYRFGLPNYPHTKPNNAGREGLYWEKPKSHIG